MYRPIGLLLVALALAAAACGPSGSAPGSPASSVAPNPSGAPSPSLGADLGRAELRYRLIDEFGRPAFCDPDMYPVGRDEVQAMRERFPQVEQDGETVAVILDRLRIPRDAQLTEKQRLAVYRDWKVLESIPLEGPDRAFSMLVQLDQATGAGVRVTGTIGLDGTVTISSQEPGALLQCPICLAAGARIAVPGGDVAIEDVRPGLAVWSVDPAGRRIPATVIRIGRTPVPQDHAVVRLVLADGRVVRASPGHPLVDGRELGSLGAGDLVDGSTVIVATLERYDAGFTYDLLASGPTGAYIADGVILASTLR